MRETGYSERNKEPEVKALALEVIRTIKDTENMAEEIIKRATADAKEQSKQYGNQNEEYYEKKIVEARMKASEVLKEYEALAAAEQQQMKADMDFKINELKAKANKNMDEAVKYVFGRLG